MGLTGTQHAITAARADVLRAGAGRSGWPFLQGTVVPLFALSGIARSGATRSNYHSARTFAAVAGFPFFEVVGVGLDRQGVIAASLSITDTLNETPNTAAMTMIGFTPALGADVVITLGSRNNMVREFGGQVLAIAERYAGLPANGRADLSLIDYTWGLNKRKVTGRYVGATVAAIVANLVGTYAPTYTVRVAADIGAIVIDLITFTAEDLTSALTQLTKRVGGDWQCDYLKVVQVFFVDTLRTDPVILNAAHRSLYEVDLATDLSQIVTRVYLEGGGGTALVEGAPGETILPVSTGSWYETTGGVVSSGPQRIRYAARTLGGGGSMVGPGASPAAAPAATQVGGAGIEPGNHDYAVSFTTAAGESVVGPRMSIGVGTLAAPTTAPTAADPVSGTGPNPGSHDYAVTFVTAIGETTAGPIVTKATGVLAPPLTAPDAAVAAGGSVDAGNHDYAVTFVVTGIGETTPSPISAQVTTGHVVPPPTVPREIGVDATPYTSLWHPGDVVYFYDTFITAAGGETTGIASGAFTAASPSGAGGLTYSKALQNVHPVSTDPAIAGGVGKYRTYVNANGAWVGYSEYAYPQSIMGTSYVPVALAPSGTNTAVMSAVQLSNIPLGDATVTQRRLYRRSAGAGLKFLATLNNNTQTTYLDTSPNSALGGAPLSVSTAYLQRIALAAIPLGGALVTARKIYRTAAGGTQRKLAATLADNTTTTWLDTVTDASLGANEPVVNTATASQVQLTGVPTGAAAVLTRKIYRTAAGGTQLKLLTTIADNTTTAWLDSAADGTLGANAPVGDTSGLAQPTGNVLAGSPTLIVAGAGGFSPTGGWAVIGNGQQVVRYSGITGSTLTGIPTSGIGAITATVNYGSSVTAPAMLTGIPGSGSGSIFFTVVKGDPVNLLVQVDDVPAQTALAALIGGDGIQEDYMQDGTLGHTEAIAKATAQLALLKNVLVTLNARDRDINTRAGRTQSVNLGPPFNITASFRIQSVTETGFEARPGEMPTFAFSASSLTFTFDDLLRLAREAGGN